MFCTIPFGNPSTLIVGRDSRQLAEGFDTEEALDLARGPRTPVAIDPTVADVAIERVEAEYAAALASHLRSDRDASAATDAEPGRPPVADAGAARRGPRIVVAASAGSIMVIGWALAVGIRRRRLARAATRI